ncbi:hypothetical protein MAESPC_00345 [Microcystis aeruginosa SPC777]|jgi:hypothetical protein|uniref:Uncharacterized protein n=1 Tax=Microcystis aeruginosa SPC777 TaxID=482300 RepID=S3JDR2_MICAE|nr:hypothetical protein MAESPC_00912 [Microcystis aeruginosa SPC777]EPF24672.1 hypothetical protein MAESPC_00345 [Microcystis aeruginosa SPC777]
MTSQRASRSEPFAGVSPDEKIFTTRDERGFLPYTRSDLGVSFCRTQKLTAEAHTPHPLSSKDEVTSS